MALRTRILERLRSAPNQGTEDAALTLLALRHAGLDLSPLLRQQLPSGAWAAAPCVHLPNTYHTALALVALRFYRSPAVLGAADHAFEWLADLRGLESHWLWQWKFRLFDRQVRFDPSKSGWPWVPGTASWVAPTALAMLAFHAWRHESPRLAEGADMLLDRACPQGGWNAGNPEAFGVELDPHPDFTAMAVLALRHSAHRKETVVQRSLDYLATRLNTSRSPYSLAWAVMALSAYGYEEAGRLRSRLQEGAASKASVLPARLLALTALALERPAFTFEEAIR